MRSRFHDVSALFQEKISFTAMIQQLIKDSLRQYVFLTSHFDECVSAWQPQSQQVTWGEYLWRDIGESQRACLHVERKRPLFMCCVLSLCAASNLCNECVLSAQRRYVSVSSLVGLDRPSLRLLTFLASSMESSKCRFTSASTAWRSRSSLARCT